MTDPDNSRLALPAWLPVTAASVAVLLFTASLTGAIWSSLASVSATGPSIAAPTSEAAPEPDPEDGAPVSQATEVDPQLFLDTGVFEGPNAYSFQTPDGNVLCGIYLDDPTFDYAGCGVINLSYERPPDPDGCQVNWASAWWLDESLGAVPRCRGGAEFGGEVAGSSAILADGEAISASGVRCISENNAMECRWIDTNGGFRVSQSSWEVFPPE